MMTKVLTKLSLAILTVFTLGFITPKAALAAPRLYLDPSSISVQKDHEFSVVLKIDAESNQVIGSDATLNYAGDDQEVVGVDNGGYFPEFTWANSATGKLEIHVYTPSIYQAKTGGGTVATIKFKAKKDSGSSTLTFGCTSAGNDTNIVNNSGQNILACSNLNQTSITYTGAPAPSPSPSLSPTPAPSAPPNVAPVCESLTLNPSSATGIPKSIAFSCKGKDDDNQITGAEFKFGDGSTPLIVSNTIGSTGVINITHSYTKAGTMNVECRLRDTSSAFSNICKQTLVIKTQPTVTPTPKPKASPTPKGKVLSLVDESTTPTQRPIATPGPIVEEKEDSKPSAKALLWILPIIMGFGLIYLLYRYYKSTPPPIKY